MISIVILKPRKQYQRSTPSTSLQLLCFPLQIYSHPIQTNLGDGNHVVTFLRDNSFGLVSMCQKGTGEVYRSRQVGRKRRESSPLPSTGLLSVASVIQSQIDELADRKTWETFLQIKTEEASCKVSCHCFTRAMRMKRREQVPTSPSLENTRPTNTHNLSRITITRKKFPKERRLTGY
jgi:hypothetical protein